MTDLNQGMFIHNKLIPYKLNKGKRFCKIIGASTYTSILKTKKILVAYKVGYWDEAPVTIEDFAAIKTYRSDITKNIIIVFELPREYMTKEQLISACMKHFLEENFFKPSEKILSEEVKNLYKIQTKKITKSNIVSGAVATAWDIVHKARYESTTGLYPDLLENYIRYRGNFTLNKEYVYNWNYGENDYIRFNSDWKADAAESVLNHLDNEATILYCNQNYL